MIFEEDQFINEVSTAPIVSECEAYDEVFIEEEGKHKQAYLVVNTIFIQDVEFSYNRLCHEVDGIMTPVNPDEAEITVHALGDCAVLDHCGDEHSDSYVSGLFQEHSSISNVALAS